MARKKEDTLVPGGGKRVRGPTTREARGLRVKKAALLLARGCKWREIAKEMGCLSAEAARQNFMKSNPREWLDAFEDAAKEFLNTDAFPAAMNAQLRIMEAGIKELEDQQKAVESGEARKLDTNLLKVMQSAAFAVMITQVKVFPAVQKADLTHRLGDAGQHDAELKHNAERMSDELAVEIVSGGGAKALSPPDEGYFDADDVDGPEIPDGEEG